MMVPEISQDMIRAYDEYTHLTLDRRGFMDTVSTAVVAATRRATELGRGT